MKLPKNLMDAYEKQAKMGESIIPDPQEELKDTMQDNNIVPESEDNLWLDDDELNDLVGSGGSDTSGMTSDMLETFAKHFASSMTMGATEFTDVGRTEDWKDKSRAEVVAALLGETAGMLNPYSGMHKLSKLGKGAFALGKQGTKGIIKQSAKETAEAATKHIKKNEVVENNIANALKNAATRDGVAHVKGGVTAQFAQGAKHADGLIDIIEQRAKVGIVRAFEESGVKSYNKFLVDKTAKQFAEGLRQGKHVNSTGKWLVDKLSNQATRMGMKSPLNDVWTKRMVQLSEEAVDEVMLLNAYSVSSGYTRAWFRGDEMPTWDETLKTMDHSWKMGVAFPILRAFPFGGAPGLTLSQSPKYQGNGLDWFKTLARKQKTANYSKILKEPGGADKLKAYIKSLRGGVEKNILAGKTWKNAKGEPVSIVNGASIDALSGKDAVAVLNQMRRYVYGQGMVNFAKEWSVDLVKSGPRMGLGAIANNTDLFLDSEGNTTFEKIKNMNMEEFATHMAIGAFFTRGRGSWAQSTQAKPSVAEYNKASNILGLDTKAIESRIKYKHFSDDITPQALGMSSDPAYQQQYQIIEQIKAESRERSKDPKNFLEKDPFIDAELEDAINAHWVINQAHSQTRDVNPVKLEFLTRDTRRKAIEQLHGVQLTTKEDGTPVYWKDVSPGERDTIQKINLGETAKTVYEDFLISLSDSGFPIGRDAMGKIVSAGRLEVPENASHLEFTQVKSLLEQFNKWGLASTDATLTQGFSWQKVYGGEEGAVRKKQFNDALTRFRDNLQTTLWGPGVRHKNWDPFELNQIGLESIRDMQVEKTYKALHDMSSGKLDGLNEQLKNTHEILSELLSNSPGRLIGNASLIDPIRRNIKTNAPEPIGPSDVDAASIIRDFTTLSNWFVSGKGKSDNVTRKQIDIADMEAAIGEIKSAKLALPDVGVFNDNFIRGFESYKINRFSRETIPAEKVTIANELMVEIGYGEGRKGEIGSAEAKRSELMSPENGYTEAQANKAAKEWQDILDFMGNSVTVSDVVTTQALMQGEIAKFDSPKLINQLWKKLPKQISKVIETELRELEAKTNLFDQDGNIATSRTVMHSFKEDLLNSLETYSTKGDANSLQVIGATVRKMRSKISGEQDKKLFRSLEEAIREAIETNQNSREVANTLIAPSENVTVNDALKYFIEQDAAGLSRLNETINRIVYLGTEGNDRVSAYKMYLNLMKKFKNELNASEVDINLNDLVMKANETRSWKDFDKIQTAVNKAMTAHSLADNMYGNREALANEMTKFLSTHTQKAPAQTLQSISEKYNLQDGFNGKPLSLDITEAIADGLITKNYSGMREKLSKEIELRNDFLKEQDLNSLKRDFFDKDIMQLITAVEGSTQKHIAKYKDGEVEIEFNKAMRLTNKDDMFIDMLKSNGINKFIQFDNVAIENGQQVQISEIGINQKLKQASMHFKSGPELTKAMEQAAYTSIGDWMHKDATKQPKPFNMNVIELSEGGPIGIEMTPNNLKRIGDMYHQWRLTKLQHLDNRIKLAEDPVRKKELVDIQENFSRHTKQLSEQVTEASNIKTKVRSVYWDMASPQNFEGQFLSTRFNDANVIKSMQNKAFKRIKLFEAKFNRFTENTVDFIEQTSPYPEAREAATNIKREGVRIVSELDEGAGTIHKLKDNLVKRIEERISKVKSKTESGEMAEHLVEILEGYENGRFKSLDASEMNAGSYINTEWATLQAARRGEKFDPTKINGFKPIGYYSDPATGTIMTQKTWQWYDPAKAAILDKKGIHVYTFESATKDWAGQASNNKNLKFLELKKDKKWEEQIESMFEDGYGKNEFILNVPVKSFAIGTDNHAPGQVTKSHSLINLTNEAGIKALMKNMGLERDPITQKPGELLRQIDGIATELYENQSPEIVKALYDYKNKQDGVTQISEHNTLVQELLDYKMPIDSPAISRAIDRTFASRILEVLRRPLSTQGNNGMLVNPREADFVLKDPIYSRVENSKTKRLQTKLGEFAVDHSWGNMPLNPINPPRLVLRENGIDLVIGRDKGQKDITVVNVTDALLKNESLTFSREASSKKALDKYNKIIEEVNRLDLSTNIELFNFLQDPGSFPGVSSSMVKLIKDSKVAPHVLTNAIPRKNYDMVSNRIKKVLGEDYGNHVVSNAYEVAVVHQRDFDMDHISWYTDMPMEYVRHHHMQAGMIRDINKLETVTTEINAFNQNFMREGSHGSLAGSGAKDGLELYKKERIAKKMAVGKAIGLNQPLTALSNNGLKLNLFGKEVKMEWIANKENLERVASLIERSGDYAQNNVDVFSDPAALYAGVSNPTRQLLFNQMTDAQKKIHYEGEIKGEINSPKHEDYTPAFNLKDTKLNTTQKDVVMDLVDTIIGINRRSQAIFNDVYEQGVRQTITGPEIQYRNRELNKLYGSEKNQFLFMRMFQKYKNQPSKQLALVELFFPDSGYRNFTNERNKQQYIKDLSSGKFWEKMIPQEVVSFNEGYTVDMLKNAMPSTKLISELASKKIFTRANEASMPQKSRTEIVDGMDNIVNSITMLRMLGVGRQDITNNLLSGDGYTSLNKIIGQDLMKFEKRSVAHTHLLNTQADLIRLIREQNQYKTPDPEYLDNLSARLTSVTTMLGVVESATMKALGKSVGEGTDAQIAALKGGIQYRNIPVGTESTMHYNHNKIGNQHIYRIKQGKTLTEDAISNLKFNNEDGISFYRSVTAEGKVFLQPGYQYFILKKPLIQEYMSNKDVQNAYSWSEALRDVDYRNYIDAAKEDAFLADLIEVKDGINNNSRKTRERAADAGAAYKNEIYASGSIKEQNTLSNFFKKWAGEENLNFNQFSKDGSIEVGNLPDALVKQLAKQLLIPDARPRAAVHGGLNKIPSLKINKRLHDAVFQWMSKNKKLDLLSEEIKFQGDFYRYLRSGLEVKDLDMIDRSQLIYNNNYRAAFEKFGDNADLVTSIMSSQFNPLGRTMGDILRNEGILNKTNPRYSNVYDGYEGTGDSKMRVHDVAPFKPGSTERAMKRNNCK